MKAVGSSATSILLVLVAIVFLICNGQNSCLDVLKSNMQAQSGVYTITLRNSQTTTSVYCDNSRLGGGWTRIARQHISAGLFQYGQVDANTDSPLSNSYSILSSLPEFKFRNSYYEFFMEWPNSAFNQLQHWRQSDVTTTAPVGFVPLSVPYTVNSFQGLRISIQDRWQSYLSASNNTWAYAVAESGTYGQMLFGPNGPVPEYALYVREVTCDSACATCSGPGNSDCTSCFAGLQLALNTGSCLNVTGLKVIKSQTVLSDSRLLIRIFF
jgi:hypothetical protein